MARSMTGYGRCRSVIDGRDITFEVKSVNNRFLDLNVKLNRLYSPLEERLKQLVRKYASRGKVDVFLTIDCVDGEKTDIAVNHEFVSSYVACLAELKEKYGLTGDIDVSLVASRPDAIMSKRAEEDIEAVWTAVEQVAVTALEEYYSMSTREGERLKADIASRICSLQEIRGKISVLAPKVVKTANERMTARVKELLGGVPVDEGRLLTECAVYADKLDITEELVRLGSHFTQLGELLDKDGNIGKTVDFLLQETNREINTIGSKSNDLEIAGLVVEAKSELEKIREQIQNIE